MIPYSHEDFTFGLQAMFSQVDTTLREATEVLPEVQLPVLEQGTPMPEIGEIRFARELGSTAGRGSSKFIWHACVDCGKQRWVPLVLSRPCSLKCFDCGIKRNLGAGNGQWRGDAIKTDGLHSWLHKYIPKPQYCERCKSVRPYDLACVTGKYNRDFQNWQWLCRRCHMLSDGRMLNLNQFRRPYQYKLIPDGLTEEVKLLEGVE